MEPVPGVITGVVDLDLATPPQHGGGGIPTKRGADWQASVTVCALVYAGRVSEQPATSVPDVAVTDEGAARIDRVRLEALRYAVNDESASYIAIMRLFTQGLTGMLSDQSAAEVTSQLADAGIDLDEDTVDSRLSYLVEHGNLARSPRETEARSLQDYLRNRARYQLTQRGEFVQRQVDELLGHAETATEISSEMLGAILRGLRELSRQPDDLSAVAPEDLAQRIGTVFAQFDRLVHSTREFDVAAIRARHPLVDAVTAAGVDLRPSGHGWIGCCPFHDDATPSLSVDGVPDRFHCFGCGATGDVIDFVGRIHNLPFRDAVALLESGSLPTAGRAMAADDGRPRLRIVRDTESPLRLDRPSPSHGPTRSTRSPGGT